MCLQDASTHAMKDMSICLSRTKLNPDMLQSEIQGLDSIYSRPYQGGYGSGIILALFHAHPRKMHATLDANIMSLDKTIMELRGTDQCNFISISDQLSGKVRTFRRGEHRHDDLFRQIFDVTKPGKNGRQYMHFPDVEIWTRSVEGDTVKSFGLTECPCVPRR